MNKVPQQFDALARAYGERRAQDGHPNDTIETPALRSLLPDLRARDVLDLGCGTGGMAQWAMTQRARTVRAVDASRRMVAEARRAYPSIAFELIDIEDVSAAPESIDVVMSGLALHYVRDLRGLLDRIFTWLRPGGVLAFSVEHPVMTCADRQWHETPSGERLHWPLDRYLIEGARTVTWLGVEVTRQHRTVATYVNTVLEVGLVVTRIMEPGPSQEQVNEWPTLNDHRRRPSFLLVGASKPG